MRKLIVFTLTALLFAACATKPVVKSKGSLPPGQMKKVTGSQSAAQYAPGQRKHAAAAPAKKAVPGPQKKKN